MTEKVTPKILIVDDESDVETLFRQYFRKEIRTGVIEFLFAINALEAIQKLEDGKPPDIIYVFSDINMPGMNGFELLSIVQQKFPSVKVCMISAYGTNEYINKAKELGADNYMTKPVDFSRLKEKIQELIAIN
jgi:two-component system, response regulator, stage 0 sporulation protein F